MSGGVSSGVSGGVGGGVGTALLDAVRMERRRMTTVRVTYVVTAAAVLIGGVIAVLIALLAPQDTTLSPARSAAALTAGGDALPLSVVGGLMALLGVVSVGQDYRFGLLQAVFTAQPRRGVVVTARLATQGGLAAGVAMMVTLVGAAFCSVLGRPPALDVGTLRIVLAHLVLAVLWTWFGAGLTWMLRSSAGAMSLLLLGPLLVEPMLTVLGETGGSPVVRDAVRWLPFAAAREALGRELHATTATIGALSGGLVFAAVTLAVVALGWLLVLRRDT